VCSLTAHIAPFHAGGQCDYQSHSAGEKNVGRTAVRCSVGNTSQLPPAILDGVHRILLALRCLRLVRRILLGFLAAGAKSYEGRVKGARPLVSVHRMNSHEAEPMIETGGSYCSSTGDRALFANP
jgi:hypothetical protein